MRRVLGTVLALGASLLASTAALAQRPTKVLISVDIEAIPGVRRVDGYTVGFSAAGMAQAYPLIRLLYRFVSI